MKGECKCPMPLTSGIPYTELFFSAIVSTCKVSSLEPSPTSCFCATAATWWALSPSNTDHSPVSHPNRYHGHRREIWKLTERQFFQRAAVRFGEEEENENQFEAQPGAVDNQPSPLNVGETNGVDIGCKERSTTAKQLEPRETTRPLHVGEQLDQVCCCKS